MTREEAIKHITTWIYATSDFPPKQVAEALDLALTTLRGPTREMVKFKEYFDELYGKGLEVYGWHLNGDPEPFDNFYERACEYAGL